MRIIQITCAKHIVSNNPTSFILDFDLDGKIVSYIYSIMTSLFANDSKWRGKIDKIVICTYIYACIILCKMHLVQTVHLFGLNFLIESFKPAIPKTVV